MKNKKIPKLHKGKMVGADGYIRTGEHEYEKAPDGKVSPPYEVTLEMAGNEYRAEGISIDDALANLNLSWEQIKAKGTIFVKNGKNSIEHLFFPKQLRMIFANKIARLLWAKRLTLFLSESKKLSETAEMSDDNL